MARLSENVYKLNQFGIMNEADSEACYGTSLANLENIIKGIKMKIIHLDEEEMEFDVIGIGPPIVNAIRRILIGEIPTMAIDRIHMFNNTSVIPDEVLAHRIGLIPIKVDPRLFVYKDAYSEDTEEDTLKFELKVKCTRKQNIPKDSSVIDEHTCINRKVLSEHLKFVPMGEQKTLYGDIKPVHSDILIAVLNPGHEIDLEAFCFKNKGRVHAKFSPVVVASYRLMPQIRLSKEITDDDAVTLEKIFPGAIKVSKKKDRRVAKVVNPRKITCHRNIYLHEELADAVEVSKVKNHYIFTVESAGAIFPDTLVLEAIDLLKDKCKKFLVELKALKL